MSVPLRIFLVDDEAPARTRIRALLEDLQGELPNVVTGEAANGHEGLALLAQQSADVALVDIHMPQMSGLEFARHLTALEKAPAVVFITAHDQYAIEAFEVNALDYLLKPVRAARLAAALGKAAGSGAVKRAALEKAAQAPRRYLSVVERGRITLVPVSEILYLRAELKYVTIRTRDREHLLEESLTGLENEFGATFVRLHRSCLVARSALRGVERVTDEDGEGAGWAVMLEGTSEKLPVSRRQWPAVKAILKG
jgi:two-component system, LytTR family, response regulator AlgR